MLRSCSVFSCLFWYVNFLIVDSDDNSLCLKFGITLNFFYFFAFNIFTASFWPVHVRPFLNINSLSANLTEWLNILKQFVGLCRRIV